MAWALAVLVVLVSAACVAVVIHGWGVGTALAVCGPRVAAGGLAAVLGGNEVALGCIVPHAAARPGGGAFWACWHQHAAGL